MPDTPAAVPPRGRARRLAAVLSAPLVIVGLAASLPAGAAPAPKEPAAANLAAAETPAGTPRVALLLRSALAALPSPAPVRSEPTDVSAASPAPASRRAVPVPAAPRPAHVVAGEAALAKVRIDPASLGYRVEFAPARTGYLGLTDTRKRVITIYVRPGQSPALLAHVVAHELGHAYETTHVSPVQRTEFLRIRGIRTTKPWYPTCAGCTDFSTGAGDFAETFAVYWTGSTRWHSTLGSAPTPAQLQALEPLMSALESR